AGWLAGGEGDGHAGVELLELADLVAGLAPGVELVVVRGSELDVAEGGVVDDVPGDLGDGAGYRDDGFLLAAPAGFAPVADAEEGVGPAGGHDRGAERAAQVRVAFASTAGLEGVPGLDGAGGQLGPGGGVPGGGELAHVGAQLRDDDLGALAADAGDLIEPLDDVQDLLLTASGARPGRAELPAAGAHAAQAGHVQQLRLDPLVQQGDLGGQVIGQLQQHADLEAVDVAEPAGQGGLQLGLAGAQPVIAERGQRGGAALAVHQGLQEPAAAGAHQVRDHAGDLQQCVLQDLLDPVLVPDPVLGQPGPQPGQRPQVTDRLRRHERAAQHAPLVQLAQPHAVQPVALGPARQVLDITGVDQPHLQPRRVRQVITPVGRRRGTCGAGPFPATPGPNRAGTFQCTRLSSDVDVQAAAGFPPWMAWWQGAQTMSVLRRIFAIRTAQAGGCLPAGRGEIGQLADLVGFHRGPLAAPLAFASQEPGDQLPAADGRGGQAVVNDRLALPFERDAAEPCDQWLPARPLLAGLVTGTRPVLGDDRGLVLAGHLRHCRAVLARQGLQHRHLSRAVQPVQFMNVPGEQVVLGKPPVLLAVGADDLEVVQVQQAGPVPRCAVDQVGGLLGLDHVPGHPQPYHAVDGGPGRRVLGDDVVAEEPRLLGTGVGNQRLISRQFQREIVAQEPGQALLDFLRFGPWTGEPEEMVIGVPDVPEPAVAGVTGIPAWQAAPLPEQFPCQGTVPAVAGGG